MASKALLVLGFLLAALVLISSEVAARELGEKAEEVQTVDPVNDPKQYYHGGYYPPKGGYYPPRYHYPPRYPPKGGGGHCMHGCCGRGYYGGCKCCTYAGEVPDFEVEAEPLN